MNKSLFRIIHLLVLLFCFSIVGYSQITVTKTIKELSAANNWVTSSAGSGFHHYTSFQLDDVITISTEGSPACGSVWEDGTEWRLYSNKNGNLIVTAKDGYELVSIKIQYTRKNGYLLDGSTEYVSLTELELSSIATKTFDVGKTGNAAEGYVSIKKFTVSYKVSDVQDLPENTYQLHYTISDKGFTDNEKIKEINASDDILIIFNKGTNNSFSPAYNGSNGAVTMYKYNTLTIRNNQMGHVISNVVVYCNNGTVSNWIVDKGQVDSTNSELIWEGMANEIRLTRLEGKVSQIRSIKVIYKDCRIIRSDLTPNSYGTICLPNNVLTYSGATFYELAYLEKKNGQPYKLFFDEVTTELDAGKPYVFIANSTEIQAVIGETTVLEAGNHNGLYGTFEQMYDTQLEGKYMFVGSQVRLCGHDCQLYANRAYIKMEEVPTNEPVLLPGRRRISLNCSADNETTDIKNIHESEHDNIQGIYDVLGRKISSPQKDGLYIVNGKKVLIRK